MSASFVLDTYICMKIAELGKRCGLRVSDIDASLYTVDADKDPEGKGYTVLDFGGWSSDPEVYEKSMKFKSLLGDFEGDRLRVADLHDLEDIVDRALSLAPRARTL